jgi:hypothetical protein
MDTPTETAYTLDNLIQRMEIAVLRLSDLAEATDSRFERARINGKIEGVRLALSYAREAE